MTHWFFTKKNWKGRKDMRRVKAEKEEMPIFLAKNMTAKGLNLHVGDIVRIYKSVCVGDSEKKVGVKSLMTVPIQILKLYPHHALCRFGLHKEAFTYAEIATSMEIGGNS